MNDLETKDKNAFVSAFQEGSKQTKIETIDYGHTQIPLAIMHKDMQVKDLSGMADQYLDQPRHFTQKINFSTIEDFCAYVNRYKNTQSTIFIDNTTNTIYAHIDWHQSTSEPSFLRHTAFTTAKASTAFKSWTQDNNKKFTQEDFALLIEDRIDDFLKPSGEQMLEIASTLKASIDVQFKSQKLTHNGQTTLSWQEDINGRAGVEGEIMIPREFTIQIKALESTNIAYEVGAWFRYRITKEKGLTLWYTLKNPQKYQDDALLGVIDEIKKSVEGVHIYLGSAKIPQSN